MPCRACRPVPAGDLRGERAGLSRDRGVREGVREPPRAALCAKGGSGARCGCSACGALGSAVREVPRAAVQFAL